MSTTDDTTPTTPKTESAATLEGVLPLHGITLLGTVVAGDASRALIRAGDGTITQVRPGDRIGQATLLVIEPGLIHLSRDGETQALAMP
ncbi:MAG TPA: amidophosphoribosyltransferase [Paracoccaceae bacterium]|nr:amidophosphoribosyltransferase [Paracoccaceae bacterium]